MLTFFLIGAATAADEDTTDEIKLNQVTAVDTPEVTTNPSNVPAKKALVLNKPTKKATSNCCSVLLHVSNGYDVFAYRRDSSYAANLYITKSKWYGKQTLKEYKLRNGYFFHNIISKDGWFVGTGGPDIVWINKALEKVAGQMVYNKKITTTGMNRARSLLRSLGMGHFIIKSPNGDVGVAINYYGSTLYRKFRMKPGQYVSVPNSPRCYRSGFVSKTRLSNPVNAAIYLAGTDRWGYNRRNIITYETKNFIENNAAKTGIKVWATYDTGLYVGRRTRGWRDNIYFLGRRIAANSIPRIPAKKFIGSLTLN